MSSNSKKALIITLPFLIFAMAMRFYQLTNIMDFDTGFFKSDSGFFLKNMVYILMAAAFVLILLAGIWDKTSKGHAFNRKVSAFVPAEVNVIGISFLLYGCSIFSPIALLASDTNPNPVTVFSLFIGSAVFLLIGFLLLGNRRIVPVSGFLMIFLAAYYTIRATSFFTDNLIITTISQRLMYMLQMLFMVLFFLNLGRVFLGGDGKHTRLALVVSGFMEAIVSFAYVGGSYLLLLTDAEKYVKLSVTPDLESIMMGALPLVILFILYRNVKPVPLLIIKSETKEEPETEGDAVVQEEIPEQKAEVSATDSDEEISAENDALPAADENDDNND